MEQQPKRNWHSEFLVLYNQFKHGETPAIRLAARDQIIYANLPFVRQEARKYLGQGMPFKDLVQEGAIGLMRALDRFDPEYGVHFITYAWHQLRMVFEVALSERNEDSPFIINRVVRDQMLFVRRARQAISLRNGDVDSVDEILTKLHASTVKLAQQMKKRNVVRCLQLIGGKVQSAEWLAVDEDGRSVTLMELGILRRVKAEIARLPPREGFIVTMRFGLNGMEYTLDEVGKHFKLSAERVRQLEARALVKLRHAVGLKVDLTPSSV